MLVNTFINRIRVLEQSDCFIRGINSRPTTNTCRRIVKRIGLEKRKTNVFKIENKKLYEKLK